MSLTLLLSLIIKFIAKVKKEVSNHFKVKIQLESSNDIFERLCLDGV
jgi:hypothetical protein